MRQSDVKIREFAEGQRRVGKRREVRWWWGGCRFLWAWNWREGGKAEGRSLQHPENQPDKNKIQKRRESVSTSRERKWNLTEKEGQRIGERKRKRSHKDKGKVDTWNKRHWWWRWKDKRSGFQTVGSKPSYSHCPDSLVKS